MKNIKLVLGAVSGFWVWENESDKKFAHNEDLKITVDTNKKTFGWLLLSFNGKIYSVGDDNTVVVPFYELQQNNRVFVQNQEKSTGTTVREWTHIPTLYFDEFQLHSDEFARIESESKLLVELLDKAKANDREIATLKQNVKTMANTILDQNRVIKELQTDIESLRNEQL